MASKRGGPAPGAPFPDSGRRAGASDVAQLLGRLAGQAGGRLREARALVLVRRAAGAFLGRRVLRVAPEGSTWTLEAHGADAVVELRRHAPLLLERLRAAGAAPAALRVREVTPPPAEPRLPPPRGAEPGPLAREALAQVADPATRARFERLIRDTGSGPAAGRGATRDTPRNGD